MAIGHFPRLLTNRVRGTLHTFNSEEEHSMKKIVYIDMDNVLVDFQSAFPHIEEAVLAQYGNDRDDIPGIFAYMKPIDGAVEAFNALADVYILSTAPWDNPSAWSDKLKWIKDNLGEKAYKRLILTHHKDLNIGDYLIDDREKNGASSFRGELLLYGSERFPNWDSVTKYLGVQV
jgi:5'(3')-deoxyribonucleotidase